MSQFDTKMTELADAIKAKNENAAAKLSIAGMIDAVNAIETGGGGNADIQFGYINADGNFQEVDLTGDAPVDTGTAIAIDAVTFNTGKEVPEYGDSTDLSFITATAEDILEGKVGADANGQQVNGTIVKLDAQAYTPGTADQTIAAGVYLAGAQTIKGDSNLNAENIAEGVSIFGVTGTHAGGGADGGTGGGSMAIYECASYTLDAGWSGYEMVWQEASGDTPVGYVKSETITEGLEVKGYTPVVGNIYNADTTIEVKRVFDGSTIPITQDGLVFYAPLQEDYVDQISGTAANRTDGSFTTFNGINCLQLDGESGTSYVSWAERSDMAIETAVTLVILAAPTESSNWRAYTLLCQPNPQSTSERVGLFAYRNNPLEWGGSLTNDVWQSFIVTRNSEMECKAYINGTYASSGTSNFNATFTAPLQVFVGCDPTGEYFDANAQGYVAFAAVYNRELSAAEVLEIHNALMEGVTQ